jgi:hypothetical protein
LKASRTFAAICLSASVAIGSVLPAGAATIGTGQNTQLSAPIILAASRDRDGWRGNYQGSRQYRKGWRKDDNGWWFPLAAFGLGAAIGTMAAQPRAVAPGGSAHVDWCYSRYRSYRAWDNTFQPHNGPRRECYSPYG